MDFYQQNEQPNSTKPDGFSIASLTCGIISVIPCCMSPLSVISGSLGLLFGCLAKRNGRRMTHLHFWGMWLSALGLVFGIVLTVKLILELPAMLADPQIMGPTNAFYEQMYGMTFEEYLQEMFGITLR